ncbi:MAG: silent information regulator protein Sir2 [Verrucomicrobia bacterium]|nr:silent information regulator protein Sir2 [Verrucomicrobiota bacterium]
MNTIERGREFCDRRAAKTRESQISNSKFQIPRELPHVGGYGFLARLFRRYRRGLVRAALPAFLTLCTTVASERLDRGVIALSTTNAHVYVGWRLLASDPADIAFDVFRSDAAGRSKQKLNPTPISDSCNIVDTTAGGKSWLYSIQSVRGGTNSTDSKPAKSAETGTVKPYVPIKLQGNYRAQKVGLADLDGDGALDFLVKQPDFNVDPYQQPGYWKKSEDTFKLEAYRHDGQFMWRYDMRWAIEEGIWYSPIVVYDIDGDGKAEVYTKAGEGDPRDPDGRVTKGPEWLVKLDGQTGRVLRKLPWPSRDGFDDYNYFCRNLLGVAYLDGVQPHLIVERGTYKIIKAQAYDPSLTLKWCWEASGKDEVYRGQGTHGLQVADIDDDGRDELVIGSAAINDDGTPMWTTRLGHPDVCYVADIDPARPGLEIFYGIEPRRNGNGVCLVEARTGKILWGYAGPTTHVHGQGMIGDIDSSRPGIECYAGEKDGSNYWLYDARGQRMSDKSFGELAPKAVFWTDQPTKVIVAGGKIRHYDGAQIGTIQGRIVAIADCLGDWREELITSVEGEIRIYSTTVPAQSRRVCLLQDRQYRTAVAMQTMGYFYPPQLGNTRLP